MPTNTNTESCIRNERRALVFTAPGSGRLRDGSRVQIVDVFALQVATGYTRDPQGRLLLEAQPSVAAGRSWSLAKAAQLIRNDARPHRWVALELNKRAWGLFWAGGGLQRCRDLLADRVSEAEACTALVPATPEALLRLMLELEPQGEQSERTQPRTSAWALIGWTSLAWLTLLGITVAGFWGALERQERKLDRLQQQADQTKDLIQRGRPDSHGPLTIR
jgi:hypothetical protein